MTDSDNQRRRMSTNRLDLIAHLIDDSEWDLNPDDTEVAIDNAFESVSVSSTGEPCLSSEQLGNEIIVRTVVNRYRSEETFFKLLDNLLAMDRFIARRGQTRSDLTIAFDYVSEKLVKLSHQTKREDLTCHGIRKTLMKKIRNRVRTVARRKAERPFNLVENMQLFSDWPPATGSTPFTEVVAKENRRILARCMAKLSEKQKQTIQLNFFGLEDSKAIAKKLGIRAEYARQLVFRGLRKLRECLLQNGFSASDLP